MRVISGGWPCVAQLTLVLTRRCQKACPECPVAAGAADMPPVILKKAIALFSGGGRKTGVVKFFGGEPLLRFDLVKYGFAELAESEYAGSVEVGTNGVLLDAPKLRYFSCRPRVQINLNSSVSVNRRFSALPNLVWNLLIPSNNPLSALRVLERVMKASGSAAPRVNVLPAYYRQWGAEALVLLGKTLEAIRKLREAGEIRLENAVRRGPVPLFNDGVTVDADGKYYHTNLVLAVKMPGDAKALLAGDLNLPGGGGLRAGRTDYSVIAKEIFGLKAAAAGFAADKLAEKILLGW